MTISATKRLIQYTGNDSATEFAYDFYIPDADSVRVLIYDTDSQETTELSSSEYSIDGLGEETFGSVTYPLAGDPISSTKVITILREVAYTQETSIQNQSGFFPAVLEAQLDFMVMQVQQLKELIDRSVIGLEGTSFDTIPLPKASLADKYLYFDSNGDPTVAALASSGELTDPVPIANGGTGSTTAAAARIALDVQAYSALLTAIAALTPTDGNVIVGNGSTFVAESGATARASLGLGIANSPQFTGIELGHATDTTIVRSGAGDITIEGNAVYRAGGTDVPVADGGTGGSDAATARTNLGIVAYDIYTGSDHANTSFPIGTVVAAYFGSGAPARAASDAIRIDNSGDASGPQYSSNAAGSGSALAGTWRSRGRCGQDSGPIYWYLFQRTA